MNKYRKIENAARLVLCKLGRGSTYERVKTISKFTEFLSESEIEEFVGLLSKSDWQGRPRLVGATREIVAISGAHGLFKVANVGDLFGTATPELYDKSPRIIKRWGLDGFDRVVELGDKVYKNYSWDKRSDACRGLWYWSANVRRDKKMNILDKKVEGLLTEWAQTGRACRGCISDYFEPNNNSTTYYETCPRRGS